MKGREVKGKRRSTEEKGKQSRKKRTKWEKARKSEKKINKGKH